MQANSYNTVFMYMYTIILYLSKEYFRARIKYLFNKNSTHFGREM